ncbi:MAG: hypothetical protein JXR15_14450 [Shimia sp.]
MMCVFTRTIQSVLRTSLTLALISTPVFAGDSPAAVQLDVNSNDFCGFWRLAPAETPDQTSLPGTVPTTCSTEEHDNRQYFFGDCSSYALPAGDYVFQSRGMHGQASAVTLDPASGGSVTNMPRGGHELSFAPYSGNAIDMALTVRQLTLALNGYTGPAGTEKQRAPLKGCSRNTVQVLGGSQWFLVTGTHAVTWLIDTPWGQVWPQQTSSIIKKQKSGDADLTYVTYDVTIEPIPVEDGTLWQIQEQDDWHKEAATLRLPSVGTFSIRAKNSNSGVSGGALFRFTDGCRLSNDVVGISGIGAFKVSVDCASRLPEL